jgi:hypothetical protein
VREPRGRNMAHMHRADRHVLMFPDLHVDEFPRRFRSRSSLLGDDGVDALPAHQRRGHRMRVVRRGDGGGGGSGRHRCCMLCLLHVECEFVCG